MNLVSALVGKLAKQGGWPLGVWGAASLLTIFIYRAYGKPLEGDGLRGMVFTYALLCIGGALVSGWLKRRRLEAPRSEKE